MPKSIPISSSSLRHIDVQPERDVIRPPAVILIEHVQRWWESVLAERGKYMCYAIFLYLPTDDAAQDYLQKREFMYELDIISGKDCLVLATSDEYVRRVGSDVVPLEMRRLVEVGSYIDTTGLDEDTKRRYTEYEQRKIHTTGYCRLFAEMFKITYDQFPCLMLFQDIDSARHIVVSLQNLDTKAIALRMRDIFTVVRNAVSKNKDPLVQVRTYLLKNKILNQKTALVNDVCEFAGKTFGYAMQAWINTVFASPYEK